MLSLLSGAFSAIAGFISWLTSYEQRKAGAQAQQLTDAKGAVKVDEAMLKDAANRTDPADVAGKLRRGDF